VPVPSFGLRSNRRIEIELSEKARGFCAEHDYDSAGLQTFVERVVRGHIELLKHGQQHLFLTHRFREGFVTLRITADNGHVRIDGIAPSEKSIELDQEWERLRSSYENARGLQYRHTQEGLPAETQMTGVIRAFKEVALSVLQLADGWDVQTGGNLKGIACLINESVWEGLEAWVDGDTDRASVLLESALTNVHTVLDQTKTDRARDR